MIQIYRNALNEYLNARDLVRSMNKVIDERNKFIMFAFGSEIIDIRNKAQQHRDNLLKNLENLIRWNAEKLQDIYTHWDYQEIISINQGHFVPTTSMYTVTEENGLETYTVTAKKLGFDKNKVWLITWQFPKNCHGDATERTVHKAPTKYDPNPEPTVVKAPWNTKGYISVGAIPIDEDEEIYENDDVPF